MSALSGIRVLDLGVLFAGPFCCTLLGEFGAEVVKVEAPGDGDRIRRTGARVNGLSLFWPVEGRNKKSVTLDWTRPQGSKILEELVSVSDALVENFRPGTMARKGLSDDTLHRINPRLVISHTSGFGQTGPLRNKPAYDLIGIGLAGLTYLSGYEDRPPVRIGIPLGDYVTGVFGAFSVLTALRHRDSHGTGQSIDLALYEAVFRLTGNLLPSYDKLGMVREREGNRSPGGHAVSGIYETSDHHFIAVMVTSDAELVRMLTAIGRDDLLVNLADKDIRGRPSNENEIDAGVGKWVSERTRDEALDILEKADIASGPAHSAADLAVDPQFLSRASIMQVEDTVMGPLRMPAVVPVMSDTAGSVRTPAPELGQHNEEIYCRLLRHSPEELDSLKADRII